MRITKSGWIYIPQGRADYLAESYQLELHGKEWRVHVSMIRKMALKHILDELGIKITKEHSSLLRNLYKEYHDKFKSKLHQKVGLNGKELWEHQYSTLLHSVTRKHYIAALDQGTGKTITTALKSEYMELYPTLIVCEASAKYSWFKSLTKEWGFKDYQFSIMYGQNKSIIALEERFVIVNYDMLYRMAEKLKKKGFKYIILDECQRVKNPKTQRYKGLREIISYSKKKYKNQYPHITFASGTPMTNTAEDLFLPLKLCEHPLGRVKTKFQEMFLEQEQNAFGGHYSKKTIGSKNIDVLNKHLANLMIRYKLEDCLDIPPKNFIFHTVDGNGDWRKVYDEAIRQACEEKQRSIKSLEANLMSANRIVSLAKVDMAVELALNILEAGKQVVVYGSFKDSLALVRSKIEKERYGVSFIDGSVANNKRGKIVEDFQTGKNQAFVGNMIAAGTSLNLQNAHNGIFLNFTFTPTDFAQAISRMYRGGQLNKVNINCILVEGTMDEYIWNLMKNKMSTIDDIIDGKKVTITNITEQVYRIIKSNQK